MILNPLPHESKWLLKKDNMPDAFLHKSSLLDKFHKEAGFKNPITQARTARSWENPITRNKREKGITAWANSFAGKAHYRKLARFNAMRSESVDTPLSKICDVLNRIAVGKSLPYKADVLEGANGSHIALHGDNKCLDISYNGNGDLEVYTANDFVGKPSHAYVHWDSVDEIAERLIGLIDTLKKGESHMASRWEDFQGFLNNVSDRLVGMYDVDPVLVQDYFDTHHSELQDAESSADSFKEKVYAVYKNLAEWAGFEVQEAKDESLRYILRESRLKKFRSEDRRGPDRYGHKVKRFTSKDLVNTDDAGDDSKPFGLAYLNTTTINAYSNDYQNRGAFLYEISTKPVSRASIEAALRKYPLHRWGRKVGIHDFFPENGVCYLGVPSPTGDGSYSKSLKLTWGPALAKKESNGNDDPDAGRLIKAAASAAWSASNAKDFKLDITSTPEEVKIHAKSPNGEDNIGVYWKVKMPSKDSQDAPLTVEQYTTWPSDSDAPERTWTVTDYDALENSFTDEFVSLQETLDVSKT